MANVDLLSNAELRVVVLVARGCSNSEIGDQLSITVNTVKTHAARAFAKTGARNRSHLVAMLMVDQRFREMAFSDVRPLDLTG